MGRTAAGSLIYPRGGWIDSSVSDQAPTVGCKIAVAFRPEYHRPLSLEELFCVYSVEVQRRTPFAMYLDDPLGQKQNLLIKCDDYKILDTAPYYLAASPEVLREYLINMYSALFHRGMECLKQS